MSPSYQVILFLRLHNYEHPLSSNIQHIFILFRRSWTMLLCEAVWMYRKSVRQYLHTYVHAYVRMYISSRHAMNQNKRLDVEEPLLAYARNLKHKVVCQFSSKSLTFLTFIFKHLKRLCPWMAPVPQSRMILCDCRSNSTDQTSCHTRIHLLV